MADIYPTACLKIVTNFLVDMYLLHQYDSNFAHIYDFHSLVIGL